MRSSIRYGNEADILQSLMQITPEEADVLKGAASMVMRFSGSIDRVPEDPLFEEIMNESGILWTPPDSDLQRGIVVIQNTEEIPAIRHLDVALPLVRLAYSHYANPDGIIFVDHSFNPSGNFLASMSRGPKP